MSEIADMDSQDYREYYGLERHLFDTIHPRFHQDGQVSAFDFFCIVIWKANRAKSKVATKLLKHTPHDLESAVRELTAGIASQDSPKERLRYTMTWGLRLPMASAILTVFYPDEFTVYDVRVCAEVGGFGNLAGTRPYDNLWLEYEAFVRRVKETAPNGLSLRDCDRYLWGRSFQRQLLHDVQNNFGLGRLTNANH